LCWGCGGPSRRREPLCAACRRLLRRLPAKPVELAGVRAWAPVGYEGPARELVRALKFRGAVALADAMAAQIAANAPPGLLGDAPPDSPPPEGGTPPGAGSRPPPRDAPVLVPVPLHPRRQRARGFNQARALAEALARRTGLAIADCLERLGAGATQVGRGRHDRRAGPAGLVRARGEGEAGAPSRALLVDDVVTTGGTLAACAAALRSVGTHEIAALAFARTLGR
jgi:predicted amidophosphoribosyltransferase